MPLSDTLLTTLFGNSNDIIKTAMEKLNLGAKKLGLHLTPGQLEQFDIYYQELLDWNQRLNLTAITGYEEVQVKHFLDSLTVTLAWQQPISNTDFRLIDVGTGAGIPGIPLTTIVGGDHDGLKVVTKAGGFGGEEALVEIIQQLKGE